MATCILSICKNYFRRPRPLSFGYSRGILRNSQVSDLAQAAALVELFHSVLYHALQYNADRFCHSTQSVNEMLD